MHQHTKNIVTGGIPLDQAKKVMIMVHGRGATAESILSLAEYLKVDDFALLAPQANRNTWYPFSFMAPTEQNEPGLSTGLKVLAELLADVRSAGFKEEDIYFMGFSQGACLVSEFVTRNAARYGGLFVLSGGLIGDRLERSNYQGSFEGMPVLLGCSDVDPHIPLQRVNESVDVFEQMNAAVIKKIYPNGPHTVYEDEINEMNKILV